MPGDGAILPPTRADAPAALARLLDLPIWIGWIWGADDRKLPVDMNGNQAGYNHPGTWATYARWREVISAQSPHVPYGGVGISASAVAACGADVLMIDADDCRDPGTGALADWAAWIVEACASYAEASPSGRGVRVIGSAGAGWPVAERKRNYALGDGKGEVYRSVGFCTVTFAPLPGFADAWRDIGEIAASLPDRRGQALASRALDTTEAAAGTPAGANPYAPSDIVAETLGFVDNPPDDDWERWNAVGMTLFRASDGDEAILDAWKEWSAAHPSYGEKDTCEARWANYHASPPDRLGYGTLHRMARESRAKAGDGGWNGGPLFAARERGRRIEGMGPLSVMSTEAGVPAAPDAGSPTDTAASSTVPHISTSAWPLHVLVDLAERALVGARATIPVFQRGKVLVMPAMEETRTFGDERTLSPSFVEIHVAAMPDLLSRAATWSRWDERKKKDVRCDPPEKVGAALLKRAGRWTIPGASSIATLPVFRPDGTVSTKAGYDESTRTYVMPDPTLNFDRIAARLDDATRRGKAAAEEALGKLDALLDEFPFVERSDRSVALSAMLTPICRGALDVAPLHAMNAPEAGGGKTFLASLCAALTLGRPPHVFTKGDSEAELEKRIGTALMAGRAIAVVDNVNGPLDGSFLCVAVEQPLVSVRVLGFSKDVELSNNTCFYATGNNISPTGDSLRRVLVCTLDPNMERPEFRRFAGNPRARMLAAREDYLVAAFTVIRAHALAGFPGEALASNPLASYGLWSRYVRGALLWLGRADPVDTMERSRNQDTEKADFRTGTELLMERQRIWRRPSWTVAHIVALANGTGNAGAAGGLGPVVDGERLHVSADEEANRAGLREWLIRIGGDRRGGIDPRTVGNWLRRRSGRVSGVLKLQRGEWKKSEDAATWQIVSILAEVSNKMDSVSG